MKKMRNLLFIIVLVFSSTSFAQESITLTSPVPKPSQTTVKIDQILFRVREKMIEIRWIGENGEAGSATYPTPAILNPLGMLQPSGSQLLNTINTGNNTTTSMLKKALQRLQTDGYVGAGAISGTPE